jgi:hypothetical protein
VTRDLFMGCSPLSPARPPCREGTLSAAVPMLGERIFTAL